MPQSMNIAVYEYPISVPHWRALDIETLLDDLARGHLSTGQEEYRDLKNELREVV